MKIIVGWKDLTSTPVTLDQLQMYARMFLFSFFSIELLLKLKQVVSVTLNPAKLLFAWTHFTWHANLSVQLEN